MRIMSVAAMGLIAGLSLHNAHGMLFSYAREHPDFCAEAWAQKNNGRTLCGSHAFCAKHKDDDRISRLVCDPYLSKADHQYPSFTIDQRWLSTVRKLNAEEMNSVCARFTTRIDERCSLTIVKKPDGEPDYRLLPLPMKDARLALRADISEGPFPSTVVRLGIASSDNSWIEVSWNQNGTGARTTQTVRLTPAEIASLLAALNRSDFWRLPSKYPHIGAADGEIAMVEVSVPGRNAHVMDAIGDTDAVDLSVLVNAISQVIRDHWKNVPGG